MEQHDIIIEQVKKFSAEVADTIKDLASKIGHNYQLLTDDDIEEMIGSPVTTILVAKTSEGKVAGMITLLVYRIPYVRKAYIDDLIVYDTYRGQGIGSKLLKSAVTIAKEKGAAYMDFTSRPRRAESNGLYEKLGFQKRETNVYRLVFDYGEV